MKTKITLSHEFVEFIPERLEEHTLYVSIRYATAAHKCCCGCGQEVITPLTPTDWELRFNGKSVSLYPSVGNWSFDCQSHYWIRHNRVDWALPMSPSEIAAVRVQDKFSKDQYFNPKIGDTNDRFQDSSSATEQTKEPSGLWRLLSNLWRR